MKKTRLSLLLAVGCALLPPCLSPADTVVEEIIARVNNEIITRTEYVRSRDQVKQDVQQQDPANADRIFT
jgi:peptidyl-prolyl cis-trans isomerase SurA